MIDTKALRSKILDLAIQGKLTEQLPEDGTAEELYEQIQKVLKKDDSTFEIECEDLYFDIPTNWRWIRLKDITSNQTLNDGDWVLSKDMVDNGPVKLIQLGSVGDLQYKNKGFKFLTLERFQELNGKRIYPGYLLINRLVADKMLVCIIPEIEGILITAVDVCWVAPQNDFYDIKYLMYALSSSGVQQKVKEVGYGTTRFRISKTNLINIPFPLPPLSEQRRIVERIEQAFSVLDTIDALQAQYADNRKALKSKLIDAAIQGKLTEQLPEDGTAEELYQQIQEEKQKLINAGKLKKEKPFSDSPVFLPYPFEIPKNWKFVRFGELMINRDSERIPVSVAERRKRKKQYDYYGASGVIDSIDDYLFDKELLLIGEDGANLLARSTPIAFIATGKYWVNNHAHVIDACAGLSLQYICLYINAISLEKYVTGSAQPKMNQENMNAIWVPLPPLSEQKRIVSALNELLPLLE